MVFDIIISLIEAVANPKFIGSIIVLALVGVVTVGMYQQLVPPEHCVENSQEIKEALSASGVSISKTETGTNRICFRSRDTELIKEISDKSQEIFLQLELEKIENRADWWDKNGIFVYAMGFLSFVAVAGLFIWSKKNSNHYW